jgi:regulatory protein
MTPPRSSKTRRPPTLLDIDGLLSYSARVLSARAQSVSEMRRKLSKRAARPDDVEEVLRRLKESSFLNDQKFAESFATWRRDTEGHGKGRVLRDLMARRVSTEIATQATNMAFSGTDETALIEEYLRRKFRAANLGELLTEEKRLASTFRRLRTAGFSAGGSIRVLKRYAAEAERLEDMEDQEHSASE